MAVVADLNAFYIPDNLRRHIEFLFSATRSVATLPTSIAPRGVLFLETLTQEMLNIQPDMDPAYLLAPDELRKAFAGWEILVYREGWEASRGGHLHPVASLVARIPRAS